MAKTIKPSKGKGHAPTPQGGRPHTDVDMDQVIECCKHLCTKEETAAICRVSADTLDLRLKDLNPPMSWTEFYDQHASDGKMSLRRALFDSALGKDRKTIKGKIVRIEPNITAQIWLSKQHLGMKDRNEVGFDPERPAKFVMNMGKKLNNGEDDE